MCARFRGPYDLARLAARFKGQPLPLCNFEFNPNVAPTEKTPILRTNSDGRLTWEMARFGLVPHWAKDLKIGATLLNARVETVKDKPAFAQAYKTHRCLIPVEGFYEWKEEGGKKQPYYFSLKSGDLMMLAGLWAFKEFQGEKIFSFTMLTGEPNELVAPFHDRMPMAIDNGSDWLNLERGHQDLKLTAIDNFIVTKMNPVMNKPSYKNLDIVK